MPLSSSQTIGLAVVLVLVSWAVHALFISPRFASLNLLPGPPPVGVFGGHMAQVMLPHLAERTHEKWVKDYGMNLRFHGLGAVKCIYNLGSVLDVMNLQFDSRLFTVDPVVVTYILNHPDTFVSNVWSLYKLY